MTVHQKLIADLTTALEAAQNSRYPATLAAIHRAEAAAALATVQPDAEITTKPLTLF